MINSPLSLLRLFCISLRKAKRGKGSAGAAHPKKRMLLMRFKVQGSLLFVTYTIIQGIIGSEMLVRTGPLNGKCKKEK